MRSVDTDRDSSARPSTPFAYSAGPQGCTASWASTSIGDSSGGGVTPVSYIGRGATIYAPSATAPTNAGDYTASASFAGDANHTGSSGSANFTIAKASTTTSVSCAAAPLTYSGSAQGCTASWTSNGSDSGSGSVTLSYSGRNATIYASSATAPTDAGDYAALASFAGDVNHTPSNGSADFTIGKATLTVTANDTTITYGAPLPTFTYRVTGYKGSDTSGILTGSATCGVSGTSGLPPGPAGSYPITCTQNTLSAGGNYTFSFAAR